VERVCEARLSDDENRVWLVLKKDREHPAVLQWKRNRAVDPLKNAEMRILKDV
jgi:hypothetical protein